MSSTESSSTQIDKLLRQLDAADAVLIGAGAGLSASAGFTYDGERFRRFFGDFEAAYGFHDMYTGGFYPYSSQEERWAYWSRYIQINRYMNAPKPVYETLLGLVRDKDYFVLTTNVDHCFQKAGFDKERLFYTQGDYGLFQCSEPCCAETFDNEQAIRLMAEKQANRRVPSDLIPLCPHCGKPLTMNLRADDRFVEDAGWHRAAQRYDGYIHSHQHARILYLELGVGYNTPGIIKYPFWQMTLGNPLASYACINAGQAFGPAEIEAQSLYPNADIGTVLAQLSGREHANEA